jgi:23S rRNA (adenine2030-N6)-methyltransferase
MNYRHAFHAGNFADVHKHSVLVRVLLHLRLKPAAFRVIDTHAGSGRYDLCGSEATRSNEWRQGIGRIWRARDGGAAQDLIQPYLDVVTALNWRRATRLSRLSADRQKPPAREGSLDRLRIGTRLR